MKNMLIKKTVEEKVKYFVASENGVNCHYLHIHFRQKCSDIIANTNILISTKRYWDYVPTSVIIDHITRRRSERTILKTLKALKAL
jgi:hypothetical protein